MPSSTVDAKAGAKCLVVINAESSSMEFSLLPAIAAAAGGVDALVFTAGIGEHAPEVRDRICEQSAWLGIRLEPEPNRAGGQRMSTRDSSVSGWVIPTDEELMVARHTFTLTNQ